MCYLRGWGDVVEADITALWGTCAEESEFVPRKTLQNVSVRFSVIQKDSPGSAGGMRSVPVRRSPTSVNAQTLACRSGALGVSFTAPRPGSLRLQETSADVRGVRR